MGSVRDEWTRANEPDEIDAAMAGSWTHSPDWRTANGRGNAADRSEQFGSVIDGMWRNGDDFTGRSR
jgi:hypothetical protein